MVLAVADQVSTTQRLECLTQQRPVVGIVVAQEGLVQAPALVTTDDVHRLAVAGDFAQRVFVGVVHRGGAGHRRWVKSLHLVCTKAIFLEPDRQVHHVFVAGARVGCDEIGNEVLLLADFSRKPVEHLFELVIAADARLHHLGEWPLLGVLRGDLQVTAHMVLNQLLHILGRLHSQVVAQAGADQYLFDAFERPAPAVHPDQRRMVGIEVAADAGVDTAWFAAGGLDFGALAANAVHVRRGSAQVGDDASETADLVADVLNFADHRVLRAALDDAPLVFGDRAERTATKTAAHDVDAETDHLPGRNLGRTVEAAVLIRVNRVGTAGIRQIKNKVHFSRGERDRRRVDPHVPRGNAFAVRLHQRARVARIGLQVKHPVRMGVQHRVASDLLIGRQANHRALPRRHLEPGLGLQSRIRHEIERLHGEC